MGASGFTVLCRGQSFSVVDGVQPAGACGDAVPMCGLGAECPGCRPTGTQGELVDGCAMSGWPTTTGTGRWYGARCAPPDHASQHRARFEKDQLNAANCAVRRRRAVAKGTTFETRPTVGVPQEADVAEPLIGG